MSMRAAASRRLATQLCHSLQMAKTEHINPRHMDYVVPSRWGMRDPTMTSYSDSEPIAPAPTPATRCAQCGEPMRCIGLLPRRGVRTALEIFRCYGCDNVVSQPK
jgi:hypothetical protein